MQKSIVFHLPINPDSLKIASYFVEQGIKILKIAGKEDLIKLFPQEIFGIIIYNDLDILSKEIATLSLIIKKKNIRPVLVSAKKIPLKTVKQLGKYGVKNILYLPMHPKTLIFKINLILKSTRSPVESKQEEKTTDTLVVKESEKSSNTNLSPNEPLTIKTLEKKPPPANPETEKEESNVLPFQKNLEDPILEQEDQDEQESIDSMIDAVPEILDPTPDLNEAESGPQQNIIESISDLELESEIEKAKSLNLPEEKPNLILKTNPKADPPPENLTIISSESNSSDQESILDLSSTNEQTRPEEKLKVKKSAGSEEDSDSAFILPEVAVENFDFTPIDLSNGEEKEEDDVPDVQFQKKAEVIDNKPMVGNFSTSEYYEKYYYSKNTKKGNDDPSKKVVKGIYDDDETSELVQDFNIEDIEDNSVKDLPILEDTQSLESKFDALIDGPQPTPTENSNISSQVVIETNSYKIEDSIQIYNLMMNKSKSNLDILKFSSENIFELYKAVPIFFIRQNKTTTAWFNSITHLQEKGLTTVGLTEDPNSWEQIYQENKNRWIKLDKITWSDPSFSKDQFDLFFPFYLDGDKLGHVIVYFYKNISQNSSFEIENYMESLKGIYLTELNKNNSISDKKDTSEEKAPQKPTSFKQKVASFFSKVFSFFDG